MPLLSAKTVLLLVAFFIAPILLPRVSRQEPDPEIHSGSPVKTIWTFDAEKKTVAELKVAVQNAMMEGATRVVFPTGEYNVRCICQEEFPTKEKYSELKILPREGMVEAKIKKWVSENDVKGVAVTPDPELPAKYFFQVERQLRESGVAYAVCGFQESAGPAQGRGRIRIAETDLSAPGPSEGNSSGSRFARYPSPSMGPSISRKLRTRRVLAPRKPIPMEVPNF